MNIKSQIHHPKINQGIFKGLSWKGKCLNQTSAIFCLFLVLPECNQTWRVKSNQSKEEPTVWMIDTETGVNFSKKKDDGWKMRTDNHNFILKKKTASKKYPVFHPKLVPVLREFLLQSLLQFSPLQSKKLRFPFTWSHIWWLWSRSPSALSCAYMERLRQGAQL